ncbi:MAG: alpha/beta hydrolase, partial [Cyanobacteriota bacterium]
FAGLTVGTAIVATAIPLSVQAATNPVRWNTGAAVWSTNQSAVNTFLKTGEVTDRGLAGGLARSGWSAKEVRDGLQKTYDVDLVGVSRFLYSDNGVKFLKKATASYFPYYSMSTYAVQALRSAIISDSVDGSISAAGIMKALPTDFRLADFCNTYTGAQNICAEGRCKAGSAQSTSLLSWYVFLPACIQANQMLDPITEKVSMTPAPAPAPRAPEPIRGLW